jgi:hypothetical protein
MLVLIDHFYIDIIYLYIYLYIYIYICVHVCVFVGVDVDVCHMQHVYFFSKQFVHIQQYNSI